MKDTALGGRGGRVARRRLIAAVSASSIAICVTNAARSDEPRTSSLSWVRLEGAEACIGAAALGAAVEERLDRKVFASASDADLNLEGTIEPRPQSAGFVAKLRMTDRAGADLGSREVETESLDCRAIDDRLALVVSLLIDPETPPALEAPPEETEDPAEPPSSAPPPPRIVERVVEKERVVVLPPPAPEPWRFAISAGFMTTVGLQPDLGLGVAPALALEPPGGAVAIVLEGGIAASSTSEIEGGAAVDAGYAHLGVALCPLVLHPGRWSAFVCGGWVLGVLSGDGEGFDADQSGAAIATGPWLEGRLEMRLVGPLHATTSIGLVMPIRRAEIGYQTPTGPREAYQTAPVGALTDLGVGIRLP